jgi:BNR repeat-like domain
MSWRSVLRLIVLAMIAAFAVAAPSAAGPLTVAPRTLVSGPSPFAGCDVGGQSGTNYVNAEVEPWVAVNPANSANRIAVWQQDRWSNGGARGLVAGVTHDGGATWSRTFAHFSICSGGTAANGGDYQRASDPWVTFAPNGDAYQISLSFNDTDATTAILVSKSMNGGDSWSEPVTLQRDTDPFLSNDKESITADPGNSNDVYAVWDRTRFPSDKPNFNALHAFSFREDILFARTTNGGASWEPTRSIFRPRANEFAIGNQILVLPNGDLVDLFTLGRGAGNAPPQYFQALVRSTDKGVTWSDPIIIAKQPHIGAFDPDTGNPIRAEGFINAYAVDPHNGNLYAAWQDSSFSRVDEIAVSISADGGLTWSTPIRVNQTPRTTDTADEQAFVPSVHVAGDGTVGVTYYDFRNNTAAPGVPTDYWIVHCHASCANAANWGNEARLTTSSFDMEQAPAARGPNGFFVGDYEGLANVGNSFVPVFVAVNNGNIANRTDVFYTTATP